MTRRPRKPATGTTIRGLGPFTRLQMRLQMRQRRGEWRLCLEPPLPFTHELNRVARAPQSTDSGLKPNPDYPHA